ncbi:chorismate-binding protein [Candidatus Woesearchaeota archaeon]|nr:chorismate-binding protein [Candidatus Woesearchaeota archaeon]
MTQQLNQEIPYIPLHQLYAQLSFEHDISNSVLLEASNDGNFHYLACFPSTILRLKENILYLDSFSVNKKKILLSNQKKISVSENEVIPSIRNFIEKNPYTFGYFSYSFAAYAQQIKLHAKKDLDNNDVFLFSPRLLFIENIKQKSVNAIIFFEENKEKYLLLYVLRNIQMDDSLDCCLSRKIGLSSFNSAVSYKQYIAMVQKAKEFVYNGDSYQIKLSQRFHTRIAKNIIKNAESKSSKCFPIDLYAKIRAINPSPCNAFVFDKDLDGNETILISNSPEQLLSVNGKKAETKPIGGTYPFDSKNGLSIKSAKSIKENFLNDEKEIAEHIMLIDLERNDLGKVCDYGTVKVSKFMDVEQYSHLLHLVTTISGRLQKKNDAFDAFIALFPGGTVTGCPKKRTMEIIDKLEPVARGVYTGSIGFFQSDVKNKLIKDCFFSIIIRTLFLHSAKKELRGKKHEDYYDAYLQVGGGIVADSVAQREYDETIWKAKAFFETLENFAGDSVKKKQKLDLAKINKRKIIANQRFCIVIIDNYDSFTYNIAKFVGEILQSQLQNGIKSFAQALTMPIHIFKNDKVSIAEIETLQPTHIIISPGPGSPEQAGISKKVISHFYKKLPILGVCLGHQCIAEVFGAKIIHAKELYHGKTSSILHNTLDIFNNCKNPFLATRYHSLVVSKDHFPKCLQITAIAYGSNNQNKEIMALKHKEYPLFGVQFHPESILTKDGIKIFARFLSGATTQLR